jgi:hypothetical protein
LAVKKKKKRLTKPDERQAKIHLGEAKQTSKLDSDITQIWKLSKRKFILTVTNMITVQVEQIEHTRTYK